MLRDITLGQYFPGTSVVHRLDARYKIILMLLYIVMVFLAANAASYGVVAFFLVVAVVLSRVPTRHFFKGLRPLLFIVVFTAFFNLFMTDGHTWFILGPLTATYEGLRLTLLMIARIFFLITGTALLTFTTSPIMLTDGIEYLLKPFGRLGVPAHEIAMMMTIALRFIPTLLEETEKIMKAQSARGADFESGNLFKRARGFVPLLVPLFVSAFRRADELAIAMESRCYRGGENRTRLYVPVVCRRDYAALGLTLVLLTAVALLRWVL